MAAENYFADSMTATVETEDSTPVSIPVGSLKEVTIMVEAEHVELTSADTILREAVAKRDLSISVTAGVAAFDSTIVQEWLGGSGSAAGSPTDDNTVATFTLTGSITSQNGTNIEAVVEGLYFPSLPVMEASEGEWIQHNYEGDARTITITET